MEFEPFEDLESMEKLQDLVGRIREAIDESNRLAEELENLEKLLLDETHPYEVEKMKERKAQIEARKAEFDEMTKGGVAEAKAREIAVRAAEQTKFNESLMQNANARSNATRREDAFLLNEEKVIEEINQTKERMLARAKERALAKAKEIARQKGEAQGLTPEEIRQLEVSEAKAMIADEVARFEDFAQKQIDKLRNGDLSADRSDDHQDIMDDHNDVLAELNSIRDMLGTEFPDVEPANVPQPEPEMTLAAATQKYKQAKISQESTDKAIADKQAEIAKVEEDLKADPDSEELKAKKEALNDELKMLQDAKTEVEQILADLKSKYNIKDEPEQGERGDGEGEGEGKGDGEGEGKGDGEGEGKGDGEGEGKGDDDSQPKDEHEANVQKYAKKIGELQPKLNKLDRARSALQNEIIKMREDAGKETDPEKRKEMDAKVSALDEQCKALNLKINVINGNIRTIALAVQAEQKVVDINTEIEKLENDKDNKLPIAIPTMPEDYYKMHGIRDRYTLKKMAYTKLNGEPGLITKLKLMMPRYYNKETIEAIGAGGATGIPALSKDYETLKEKAIEEKKAALEPAIKATEGAGKTVETNVRLAENSLQEAEQILQQVQNIRENGAPEKPKQPERDGLDR